MAEKDKRQALYQVDPVQKQQHIIVLNFIILAIAIFIYCTQRTKKTDFNARSTKQPVP